MKTFFEMKKGWKIFWILILFLMITNPSRKDLAEYLGWDRKDVTEIEKKFNGFIFSVYHEGWDRYFGIAGNFFKIERGN